MRKTIWVDDTLFSFIVTELPGNPDVAVLHGLFRLSGPQGNGKFGLAERCNLLYNVGYSSVQCTVDCGNQKEIACLEFNGFSCHHHFTSRRTGHKIGLWCKELK